VFVFATVRMGECCRLVSAKTLQRESFVFDQRGFIAFIIQRV
jgi:hypothetical protein